MHNKLYRNRVVVLMVSGWLMAQSSAGVTLAEDFFEEDVSASEWSELSAEGAADSVSSDDQSGKETEETGDVSGQREDAQADLIVDTGNNQVDASLPAGLDIAEQVAQTQDPAPIVTVDPSVYPAANFSENAREVYWFCRLQLGLNHAASCGVLANVQLESGFRPIALGDGGTSYGICQWHLGRCTMLMSYCTGHGLDYNTLEGQLSYLQYELTHGYTTVYANLLSVPDTAEGAARAGWLMCMQFEMPDQANARGRQRGNLARYNYFSMDFQETARFHVEESTAVYSKADEDSRLLLQLSETKEVSIVEVDGGWAKIIPADGTWLQAGFVKADQLIHIKETDPLTDAEEDETEAEEETEETLEEESEKKESSTDREAESEKEESSVDTEAETEAEEASIDTEAEIGG